MTSKAAPFPQWQWTLALSRIHQTNGTANKRSPTITLVALTFCPQSRHTTSQLHRTWTALGLTFEAAVFPCGSNYVSASTSIIEAHNCGFLASMCALSKPRHAAQNFWAKLGIHDLYGNPATYHLHRHVPNSLPFCIFLKLIIFGGGKVLSYQPAFADHKPSASKSRPVAFLPSLVGQDLLIQPCDHGTAPTGASDRGGSADAASSYHSTKSGISLATSCGDRA